MVTTILFPAIQFHAVQMSLNRPKEIPVLTVGRDAKISWGLGGIFVLRNFFHCVSFCNFKTIFGGQSNASMVNF